ncbi:hypothetical protein FRC07_009300 [Ceratobasidium sp. 392]|nr:hypothetical protein FRC07_009300 [Ceratobasidium sp. 392]
MKQFSCVVSALAVAGYVSAQQGAWAQCGGQGWTGGTTCVSGLPGTAAPTTTTTRGPSGTSTTTSTAPTATNSLCPGALTKFKYFGASQSCAEFGETKIPGVLGTDYTWPAQSSIDQLMAQGMNTFRIPFLVERLVPPANGLGGAFDQTYLSGLKSIVTYITNKGGYAAIDPHNYMRYNGNIITSTSDFAKFWTNLSNQFKSNSKVIFDIMNEPNGIAASDVYNLNQAAVNAIRAAGATSQLILVEGTSWTGAWTWVSAGNGDAFKALKDPSNNIAIEMHQYLDSDGSGTSGTCVSSTIAAERLAAATSWLKANNFKGFLGEIGGGSNDVCIAAIKGGLCAMQQSGVWLGVTWWAAGPWWGTYFTSIEPPSGAAIARILPEALKPFM